MRVCVGVPDCVLDHDRHRVSHALLVPINYLVHRLADTTDVSAVLMPRYAAILVILSMVVTLIGGLIPSASAA